jgi:hypothetical protein
LRIDQEPGDAAISVIEIADPADETLKMDHVAFLPGICGDPGDFNCDEVVDLVDFGILRDHLYDHIRGPVTYEDGDINRDRKVDLSDFGEFKALFPGGVAAASSIPEPSSGALVLVALAGITALVRSRGHHTHPIEN